MSQKHEDLSPVSVIAMLFSSFVGLTLLFILFSSDRRLQQCEKYGVFSKEKFAKLEADYLSFERDIKSNKVVSRGAKNISQIYNEQLNLRNVCLYSSNYALSFKMELHIKEKEVQQLRNELMDANSRCSSEEEKVKKFRAAVRNTTKNIDKSVINVFGIVFDPFQQCLKNYNDLVHTLVKIDNSEL